MPDPAGILPENAWFQLLWRWMMKVPVISKPGVGNAALVIEVSNPELEGLSRAIF